jgi:DmsE family decaheme c-type cytochrome
MKRLAKIALLYAFAAVAVAATFPAVAADEAAPVRLAQDAVCTKCHDESETKPILAMYQTPHGVTADARTPSCQSCHGQSAGHLAGDKDGSGRPAPDVIFGSKHTPSGYQPSEPQAQAETCLSCHKEGLRTHWSGSQHQTNDVVCSNCHKVHAANDPMLVKVLQPDVCFSCHKEQRAQTHQFSTHPLDAGKMACSDCHNPHGSAGPKLLAKNTVTETCLTCHAEKRGPFLWEHQPVNEDCTNCHTPHGSNISPLLKSRPPFMCDECHDGPHNSQAPYGTAVGGIQGGGALAGGSPNSNAVGRSCMNCHVMIHGSNSPTGAFLHH